MAAQTLQFNGTLAERSVLILVDSGSSHSFISSSVASSLPGLCNLNHIMNVCVANGTILQCKYEILDVEWQVQGYRFHSTLRVLLLSSYDLILRVLPLSSYNLNHRMLNGLKLSPQ